MSELETLQRQLARERRARKEAEALLESKSRELFAANEQLRSVHQQLMDAARRAGMAEIATGVLHNVGNVLNSINVSANLAVEQLSELQVEQLQLAVDLIREHGDNLAEFFSQHPKGRKLTLFLALLAERLSDDRQSVLRELVAVTTNLGHINAIIASQQEYAGMSGLIETLDVATLIGDALQLNASAFERHGIEVIGEDGQIPRCRMDKQRVLQILVNLIKNAKESLLELPSGPRRLILKTAADDEMLRIEVRDNGVGIAAENLTRIFSHGFTTKRYGHGFGLHNCANAAQEMGGSLSVHSAGPNQGATFTLALPFRPDGVSRNSIGDSRPSIGGLTASAR